MNKIPMRRCVVSGQSFPKKELLRIVKTPEGKIVVDPTGKLNGKGAYIKKDSDTLKLLIEKNVLEKTFGIKVDASIYDEIEKLL